MIKTEQNDYKLTRAETERWASDADFREKTLRKCFDLARRVGRPVYLLSNKKSILFTARISGQ